MNDKLSLLPPTWVQTLVDIEESGELPPKSDIVRESTDVEPPPLFAEDDCDATDDATDEASLEVPSRADDPLPDHGRAEASTKRQSEVRFSERRRAFLRRDARRASREREVTCSIQQSCCVEMPRGRLGLRAALRGMVSSVSIDDPDLDEQQDSPNGSDLRSCSSDSLSLSETWPWSPDVASDTRLVAAREAADAPWSRDSEVYARFADARAAACADADARAAEQRHEADGFLQSRRRPSPRYFDDSFALGRVGELDGEGEGDGEVDAEDSEDARVEVLQAEASAVEVVVEQQRERRCEDSKESSLVIDFDTQDETQAENKECDSVLAWSRSLSQVMRFGPQSSQAHAAMREFYSPFAAHDRRALLLLREGVRVNLHALLPGSACKRVSVQSKMLVLVDRDGHGDEFVCVCSRVGQQLVESECMRLADLEFVCVGPCTSNLHATLLRRHGSLSSLDALDHSKRIFTLLGCARALDLEIALLKGGVGPEELAAAHDTAMQVARALHKRARQLRSQGCGASPPASRRRRERAQQRLLQRLEDAGPGTVTASEEKLRRRRGSVVAHHASRVKTRYDSFVATDVHSAFTPGESTDAPAQPPLTPRAQGDAPA